METPELQVTSASEFRRIAEQKKVKLLELPSGFVVKLQRPDLLTMVRKGYIPADLIEVALNASEDKKKGIDSKVKKEDLPKFFDFMATIIMACSLEPKIVDKPVGELSENEVSFDDLEEEDKTFIFNWWKEESEKLNTFRTQGQDNDEKSGPGVQEISGE